jgi:hypothetical protein
MVLLFRRSSLVARFWVLGAGCCCVASWFLVFRALTRPERRAQKFPATVLSFVLAGAWRAKDWHDRLPPPTLDRRRRRRRRRRGLPCWTQHNIPVMRLFPMVDAIQRHCRPGRWWFVFSLLCSSRKHRQSQTKDDR